MLQEAKQVAIRKAPAFNTSGSNFDLGIKGREIDNMRGGASVSEEGVFTEGIAEGVTRGAQSVLFFFKAGATPFEHAEDIAAPVGV
ncbi:MAG: hypothetical protein ACE5Z5_09705 [Candidatus Bathyarchaeia archaeon]